MVEKNTGVNRFLKSSDDFFGKVARMLDNMNVDGDVTADDLVKIRELSEIIKINAMSIKALRDEEKGIAPSQRMKIKGNNSQFAV